MIKLKSVSLVILFFSLTSLITRGDEPHCGSTQCEVNMAELVDEKGFSLFSFLKSKTPFQQALEASAHATPDVLCFYEKIKNEPVWFTQNGLTKHGEIAKDVLQNADLEGLNPIDYEDAALMPNSPEDWMENDILFTKRFLEFMTHLRTGRIDPMKISSDIKFHSPKTHVVDMLVAAVQDKKSGGNKLRLLAPNLPQYAELKRILKDYREHVANTNGELKLSISKILKLGESDPEVVTLRQILVQHQDLSKELEEGEKFDAAVDKALRAFQKRYSLEPDGVIGNKTKEALNYSLQDRIKQVIVNMERLRWLPDDLGDKHIIVNVAGYVLHGFEKSTATLMMPIIVGRPDRRTPLFYTNLKNIVLNPSWGVPHSIYLHDKLPRIKKDPAYVRRSNFTITDHKGRVIDPDAADWENAGKSYFLRQSPGSHNALGRIKFNIENPYVIYMHGTPDQHLFAKKSRALSSGCIRLKYPLKLAVWVLNNESLWPCNTLETIINKGETQTIKPAEYIPVYFTYQTIWVKENEHGKRIFHSNDPYKLDAKMIKMLHIAD